MADPEEPGVPPEEPPADSDVPRAPIDPRWQSAINDLLEIGRATDQIADDARDADLFRLSLLVTSLAQHTGRLAFVLRTILEYLPILYDWKAWAADMRERAPGAETEQADAVFRGLDALIGKWIG